jgi:hypothetical protein
VSLKSRDKDGDGEVSKNAWGGEGERAGIEINEGQNNIDRRR